MFQNVPDLPIEHRQIKYSHRKIINKKDEVFFINKCISW